VGDAVSACKHSLLGAKERKWPSELSWQRQGAGASGIYFIFRLPAHGVTANTNNNARVRDPVAAAAAAMQSTALQTSQIEQYLRANRIWPASTTQLCRGHLIVAFPRRTVRAAWALPPIVALHFVDCSLHFREDCAISWSIPNTRHPSRRRTAHSHGRTVTVRPDPTRLDVGPQMTQF